MCEGVQENYPDWRWLGHLPGVQASREVSGEVWCEDSGVVSTRVTFVLVFARGLIFVVRHLCISLYARSAGRGETLIR